MGDEAAAAAAKKEINVYKYIEQRVATAFPGAVGPKFTAKYAAEQNEACIKEFLESEDITQLIFSGDNIVAAIKMPPSLGRGKTTDMFMNEITNNSVEYLERLISEIYLPLFSNPANQEGWGEAASKEVVDKFHSYMASVSITKQIKNVLKQDPEDLLKQGLHPTPDAEIEFWKLKAANLNSIFEQLQSKKVRKILTALDRSKSTYCTTFARLCKEVFTARIEANDNMKYLHTLEEWFIRLNNDEDFPSLTELFKPMLHIILLIWKNSKHYNTPARLVVLMREICNSLIDQARKYLSGELIFQLIDQDEAGIAVEQLKTTLQVCSAFKSTYFDYKATANAECPSNPWRIQGNALFTIVQFCKLSKIEVGGTNGKTPTLSVQQIHMDFTGGTGKTMILKNFLRDLDEDMLFSMVNMNYYTDSYKLQQQLESVIDKRSGRMFGPPATKKLIYFIDDLNLPYIDRIDLGFRKEIVDVQYLSAMNPTAGSFIIDERLQRHYALFACMMPGRDDLKTIYNSILKGHFQNAGFSLACVNVAEAFVNLSILLHEDIANRFLPSATKFVYNWNMRELSNIFQGLTRSKGDYFPGVFHFARLWVHEAMRVFCDRLINDQDIVKLNDRIREITKKMLPDVDHVALFNDQPPSATDDTGANVNIFTTFAIQVAGADSVYVSVASMKHLNKVLVEQLDDYNSKYSMMNLELFDSAMEHVTRICRIIGNPDGNAMLIGLSVTSNFCIEDLKENLAEMFSVTDMSKKYFETQRRYNYVAPKSFLELIRFYEIPLKQEKEDIQRQVTRLDDGLSTLRKTSADVAELQVDLKHTMIKVAEK
ncbi:Sporangia induced dynein heavy chain, partial [Globisporangium splendens]